MGSGGAATVRVGLAGLGRFGKLHASVLAALPGVVLAAAERAEVPLQIGFLLRFETRHALLKAEIAAGRFGPLVSLRAKRNVSRAWFPAYGDRAHPVDETSFHDIDVLLWDAASPCTAVYAVERNHARLTDPDACWAMLQFANGAVGVLETSWFVPAGAPANVITPDWHGTTDRELEVVGTDCSGRIRLLDGGLAVWQPDRTAHPETSLCPESGGSIGGAVQEKNRHFIDRVRDGSASLIADAADALSGLRVAAAIAESACTGVEVRLAA